MNDYLLEYGVENGKAWENELLAFSDRDDDTAKQLVDSMMQGRLLAKTKMDHPDTERVFPILLSRVVSRW